jgi:probable F420-dependent oxidoreductase
MIDGALLTTDPAGTATAARTIEAQGFDGLLSFEGAHDPFVPLVVAAEHTTRLTLTTAIAIAFARNPMTCAYMANDLQLLSRGRFVLGLGTQIRPHIEKRFGQTWSRPNARMREFVRAIRAIFQAWDTGERLDFRGTFYTHTLMTPFFSPGPNPYGRPKIALAGFGPRMIAVAGEVADGWIVHPLHTPSYVRDQAMPALETGLAKSGRTRRDVEIASQTIVMMGDTDEQLATARMKAKGQIAFYGSTPAYRPVLELHGWGDLQPELNNLSKQGEWVKMGELIDDDVLSAFAVVAEPDQIGAELKKRYAGVVDRCSFYAPYRTDPEQWAAAIADLKKA